MPETIDARADGQRSRARRSGSSRARRSATSCATGSALTGTKISCDAQVCGACTVLVDGLAVSACTYLAIDADGRDGPDGRGSGDGRTPQPAPAGVHRPRRVPVRLLHARHADGGDRPPRGEPRPDPGGGHPRPRGQPLPLHRLRPDRRRGPGRRAPRPTAGSRSRRDETRHARRPVAPSPIGAARPAPRRRRQGHRAAAASRSTSGCPASPTPSSCAAPIRTRRIRSIDTAAARRHPGVIAVVTADDLGRRPPRLRPLGRGPSADRHRQGPLRGRAGRRRRRRGRRDGRGGAPPDQRRVRAAAVRHDRPTDALATDAPDHPRAARRAARPPRLRRGHRADPPQRLLALAPGLGRHRRRVRRRRTS